VAFFQILVQANLSTKAAFQAILVLCVDDCVDDVDDCNILL
jgi:hypothetical protein